MQGPIPPATPLPSRDRSRGSQRPAQAAAAAKWRESQLVKRPKPTGKGSIKELRDEIKDWALRELERFEERDAVLAAQPWRQHYDPVDLAERDQLAADLTSKLKRLYELESARNQHWRELEWLLERTNLTNG